MLAETITVQGHKGDVINAYFAKPLVAGPFPGMLLIHHAPGWDEWYRETAGRFAHHGYVTISPNLYQRAGHGDPAEVGAKVRKSGGVPDDQALGDVEGAMRYVRTLPYVNGIVGVFGTYSEGRLTFLTACPMKGFDAAVDCWGGPVVASGQELTPNQPVAPIDYTGDLTCPLLGEFGNEDQSPAPEQVNQHEEELKRDSREPKGILELSGTAGVPILHKRASLMAADIIHYADMVPSLSLSTDFQMVASILP